LEKRINQHILITKGLKSDRSQKMQIPRFISAAGDLKKIGFENSLRVIPQIFRTQIQLGA